MTSHVVELPILTEPWEADQIDTRLEAAKEAYNACLGEYLRRVKLAQGSLAMKKAGKGERSSVYRDFDVRFSQRAAQLIRMKVVGDSWIRDHLTAGLCDSLAERAAKSVEDWIFGPSGRPYFKTASRFHPLDSVQTSNGLEVKKDPDSRTGWVLVWSTSRGGTPTLRLDLEVSERAEKSLANRADYPQVGVKRKKVRGEWRYYCDCTCNGSSPYTAEPTPKDAPIGVVVRPTVVTVVSEGAVWRTELCVELSDRWRKIKRLDRKISRQKRAANPDKVMADGRWKPREAWESKWQTTEGLETTLDRRKELYRRYEQQRKRLHEKLANEILSWGTTITLVDRPYKILKQLGRGSEIRDCGPGRFCEILEYKAESTGGFLRRTSAFDRSPFKSAEVAGSGVIRDLLAGLAAQRVSASGDPDAAQVDEIWDEAATRLKGAASAVSPTGRHSLVVSTPDADTG